MGDVVFTLPLANVLKSNGYNVSWLVGDKGIKLLQNNPAVDEVIYFSETKQRNSNIWCKLKNYFRMIKYIRSKKFDIVIDTQGLMKTFVWTRFCGARRRIVSKSAREGAIFGGNEIIEKLYDDWNSHVVQDYLKFAKHLSLNTDSIKVTLPPSSEEIVKKIENLISGIDRNKMTIVLAPATTWKPKHWNKEHWKTLVEQLKDDYNLIFTGTSKDDALIKYISDDCGINLAGKTDVAELCELFRHADLVISLDSGSTHLAWAVQIPKIVSIFCCTPATRYAPLGDSNKYIALQGHLRCQPCHKKKCPLNTVNECTNYPAPEEVLQAVYELLQ